MVEVLYEHNMVEVSYQIWWYSEKFIASMMENLLKYGGFINKWRKRYISGPRYWNVPVLVNTGTFLVYQYCPKMGYLHSLEHAGGIQKQAILEHQKNGLVLSNTRVPVPGTWSFFFPEITHDKLTEHTLPSHTHQPFGETNEDEQPTSKPQSKVTRVNNTLTRFYHSSNQVLSLT